MKLSRTVAYAVRATLQLAKSQSTSPVPCSQLAAEGQMPERFLLQILRNLVTHGILRSTRGVDGGYSLVRPAEEVSLLEVIEAIEGPLSSGDPMSDGTPTESQRRLHDALQQVTANSRRQLEAIKLSQLLAAPPTPNPQDAGAQRAVDTGAGKGRTKQSGTDRRGLDGADTDARSPADSE